MHKSKFKFTKVSITLFIVGFITISALLNSCMMLGMGGMGHGHSMHHGDSHNHEAVSINDSTSVREGVIEVNKIDLDKDGYVYQCPMDAEVISNEAGKCTLCGMKLKKVTNDEATRNLE